MTIAVTTPTGHLGSHVARMLCQSGVRPRLLLRNPDRLDSELRGHVELAVGDQRDGDYVAEATRGTEAVFWVHPDDWSLPDPDAAAERTGEGLAIAMPKNRIARVVFQSSIGAEVRRGAASSTAWPESSSAWTRRGPRPARLCSTFGAASS